MMSLKHAALIASSAAASLLMIGAAGEASEQSGELTIYTSMAEPAINAVEKAFEAAYPDIDATVLRLVTGTLATRFANQAESNVEAEIGRASWRAGGCQQV